MPEPSDATSIPNVQETVVKYHQIGYTVVTPEGPDDGGDFGPNTPGTRTCGIQEALNHIKEAPRPKNWAARATNLYICHANYLYSEPIHIPPMDEHFRLDARDASLTYQGSEGDAVRVDSLMNCELNFGYIVAGGLTDGACLRVKPENPLYGGTEGPVVVTCSSLSAMALVGSNPGGNRDARGVGLWLDASSGSIIWSNFFLLEVNGCHPGILSDGGAVQWNRIISPYNHECGTALQLGTAASPSFRENEVVAYAAGREAVRIAGSENRVFLEGVHSEAGKNLIFEASARNNVVHATSLPQGITNDATHPTNRVVLNTPVGYSIETPSVPPSGAPVMNRNPYTVEVSILDAGNVSGWVETDANGDATEFSAGLTVGQRFVCDPGDQLSLRYSAAPTWKWKALR